MRPFLMQSVAQIKLGFVKHPRPDTRSISLNAFVTCFAD